jgi:pyruvate/2-oxoglutarate dehydrogenase complex dihydrolipoamide dehydrogenase (E3) component
MRHFDYLVIGGGSGGIASARRAAQYGAKVLLFLLMEKFIRNCLYSFWYFVWMSGRME